MIAALNKFDALRTLHAEDGLSLWHDGVTPLVLPSQSIAALTAHQARLVTPWFDRVGHRVFSGLRRLSRPESSLHDSAVAIVARASSRQQDDDLTLQHYLRECAASCRLVGVGQGRAEATDAALVGVVLAVARTHGFFPYVEQVMGALALLDGHMAEMATGEGKTITAAMAAVVAAWRGLPCHVVTANDYLARRDAELGQKLFHWCQVSAASIDGDTQAAARAAAYRHDVVFCTAKELLGDYLRDGLILGKMPSLTRMSLNAARAQALAASGVVMRGIFQVIVDEADSVLIDEAVTPLIISAQRPDNFLEQAAHEAVRLARRLRPGVDFKMERALRHIELTAVGRDSLTQLAHDLAPFWRHRDRARELVEMALYASELMKRDQHYVIEDDKLVLVDELTGRLAHQRTLSLGMQQILEASEGISISPPSEVSARLSFQRFFQHFNRLGGMTGTANEARGEFSSVYRLVTLRIPTHRPLQRQIWPMVLCRDELDKFDAIAHSALKLIAGGRPVLVGMRSVRSSEALAHHVLSIRPDTQISVLHAVNHGQEAEIVARAGNAGALTIATNMAGRGTDIALDDAVRSLGGLHVIIGESNDYGRIDRQLIGRCARQGDPGSVQRFIAFDDELVRRFLSNWMLKLWRKLHAQKPLWAQALTRWMLMLAQNKAEGLAVRQRQNILKQDIELDRSGF